MKLLVQLMVKFKPLAHNTSWIRDMASTRTQGSLGRSKKGCARTRNLGKCRIYTGVYEKTELATTPYQSPGQWKPKTRHGRLGFLLPVINSPQIIQLNFAINNTVCIFAPCLNLSIHPKAYCAKQVAP